MDSQSQDIMAAFGQLFTPTVQFPRWFQPDPTIGQILVHSQEEEDELRSRDWTPKPLPGSESPITKVQSLEDVSDALQVLQNERDLFEQQKATFMAQLDAKMVQIQAMGAAVPSTPPLQPDGAAPDSAQPAQADMPGGLSDASDGVEEETPPAPPAPTPKSSKK